ncbi:NAD(P)-dependent oxidoreductase [Francisella sp. 19X1-34]|uniref:NAD(P)-dependent oxidoreductase n=1 Tax=Francisella sp. 19X1-34 TaxID=3087177 RepID=UPI002E367FD6|nr:NAD(P)-dependent oxidoreductase [Francisella sp. 19X1-34]MED7789362.1 NAD(P)-dependent oxidoreductase [Francisella sp. 19X1-34]
MLNIVVLETAPYKKEDFIFLQKFGNVKIYDKTSSDEIIKRISGVDVVIVNKSILSEEHFKVAPKLRYIGVMSTGVNSIDLIAARKYNITVTNVPAYGTDAVAQHTFALILHIINKISLNVSSVKNDSWAISKEWCLISNHWNQLSNMTIGIIGFGNIGKKVSSIAKVFGMKVLVYSRSKYNDESVCFVSLNELLKNSDIVSLHCPLTKETKNIIGSKELSLMKKSSILINVSRGNLIDEKVLYDKLSTNEIKAAGLDVLAQEPPSIKNDLNKLDNCYITPHIAWTSIEAMNKILDVIKDNIESFLASRTQNVVN